jgi:hypothetical protein
MAQVPHVKTCVAIYQHSPNPPIQYPVGRLLRVRRADEMKPWTGTS